jgi:ribosomal protein S18 acetylase RimI-like enzyme
MSTSQEPPLPDNEMEPCARCRAKGIIVCPVCQGTREIRNTSYVVVGQCQDCREGRGFITCPNCLGKKVVDAERLREMRRLESEAMRSSPAVWGFTAPTPPRRISSEAVARTEAFERENREVIARTRALERDNREVIAKTRALERESGEVTSLITLDSAKVDEILTSGVSDDISQPQAVDMPAESKGLEQMGETSAGKSCSYAAASFNGPESCSENKWLDVGTMNLAFRRARPSDVGEAIPLIYSSGPHELDYAFAVGRHKALDFLRIAFVDGSSTLGYGGQVVAVVDGHVVGIGASHDGAEFGRANRKIIYPVARFYGPVTGAGVLTRLTQLEKQLWPPPKKHDVFIQNLGVREDMRGKGIGTALLTRQIEMARTKGFRRCILDVAVTNPRAQGLYERLGFRVVEEREWHITSSTAQVPDSRRMGLSL